MQIAKQYLFWTLLRLAFTTEPHVRSEFGLALYVWTMSNESKQPREQRHASQQFLSDSFLNFHGYVQNGDGQRTARRVPEDMLPGQVGSRALMMVDHLHMCRWCVQRRSWWLIGLTLWPGPRLGSGSRSSGWCSGCTAACPTAWSSSRSWSET